MPVPAIADREVRQLAHASQTLQKDYARRGGIWEGSPFAWIGPRPPRQKGALCERLVSSYLEARGFHIARSPDTEADRLVDGVRMEIKSSTLWEGGFYQFQQLRDQNYRFVLCLGISPFDAHCWAIPKGVVMERWRSGAIASQHGGRRGKDTAWLKVTPGEAPGWLRKWGGSPAQAAAIVARLTRPAG